MSGSLARLAALATACFRQALRDKVLYVLAGFCALLIAASLVISELTVGERGRIVMDLGLSATAILASLVAVFVTIGQVGRELERKTIIITLSKPVARWEVIAGRFLGMAMTLLLMVAAMASLHALVLAGAGGYRPELWSAAILAWSEAMLTCALALFISSFATPLPSMFLTLGFVLIGHTSWGLAMMAEGLASPAARAFFRVLYMALPNLELLNVRQPVTWGLDIPATTVVLGVGYSVGYSAVLLALAAWLFSRRDLA